MFETSKLKLNFDYLAPDKSEIRLLLKVNDGSMWHCTLPPGRISKPVCHKSVAEMWFFIRGRGKLWRKSEEKEDTVDVEKGTCVSIPPKTSFQFRNVGSNNLRFVGVTMPPWPGPEEAFPVHGYWEVR